ncbi:MAG: hypothetical protein JRN51_07020 [Nitrososphaerota archaeon]|nr:hypothetical protein [Nitrososphaerota archaeon]
MPKNRKDWIIIATVIAAATVVGVSSLALAFAYHQSPSTGGAYSNGPFQTGGMMGGSWNRLSAALVDSVSVSQPVSVANGTLTFSGDSIRVLVLMGPMTEGQSMYSFLVDNVTDPTLVLPKGSTVTMTVVNVDTDAYHGLTFTTVQPPYSYNFMPMTMSLFASSGVLPPSSSGFASQQISFTVTGDMYYVCPVAGHAQSGMYGLIRAE